MLRAAKALGDVLIVVLSNDAHNHKPNAVPARLRLRWMRGLGIAERVVVGKPDSFAQTLRRERPDVLALGWDQKLPDEATERVVRELKIRVVTLPKFPGKEETVCSL